MSEKQLVVDGLELKYSGIFDMNELLQTIDKYTGKRGYAKGEKRREEKVAPSGKEFSMELRHTKKKTDYFQLMIKMRLSITNLKDVEVVKDNIKKKMQQGNVLIIFDAWTTTDMEWRWEQKPLFIFFREIFERLIYKFHKDRYYNELSDDCHFVYENVKAHLNLFKY